MSRTVRVLAALLLAPLAAAAQTSSLQRRAQGDPAGIPIPGLSVAGAEEATALEVNPAGIGFTKGPSLHYFHEGRPGAGLAGDGFWLAAPLGPLVPALSMQWIRPGEGGGPRFRKTALGLALATGETASLAVAWNWFSSPDRDLDALSSFDAGLTVRPWRHLSVGLTALDLNARRGGARLPIRYLLGGATRLYRDSLTLSADLIGDDQGRGDLMLKAVALGLGVEVGYGLALQGQIQFPAHGGLTGAAGSTYGQLALTVNGPHEGVTLSGGAGEAADRTWLVGARVSVEGYRSVPYFGPAPSMDLARALSRPRLSFFGGERDPYRALLKSIEAARDDPTVPALALRIDDLPLGAGRIEELRALILSVKARKPVLAYLVGGGMREYYLASAASLIAAPPFASLLPGGLSTTTPFLKEGLGKLGVTFDVVAVGRYKSAGDPLVRREMGEAQREATESILDDIYARVVKAVASARSLGEGRVRELVNRGAFSAEEARAAGLIDAVAWPDEIGAALSRAAGRDVRVAESWSPPRRRAAQRWGPRPAVALIRLEGAIATGPSRGGPLSLDIAGSDTIVELLGQAARDPDVKAVILRVESGGGSALASDLIGRRVLELRREGKPVVASMGDIAASGGYMASACADAIVAEPSTLTGSIGVLLVKPDFSGLLKKIGVNVATIKRGEHADLTTVTRRWTAEERALVARQVAGAYDEFIARVAGCRRMTKEAVERVAGGRVWTGAQAKERGLVDQLGTLEDALRLAKERAGFQPDAEVELRPFEPEQTLLARLARGLDTREQDPIAQAAARIPDVRAMALLLQTGPLLAVPPAWILGDGEVGSSPTPAP
jgi:protease-4